MIRIPTLRADFAVVPPVGTAHLDVCPSFHPPSLRNPDIVPVDEPLNRLNRFYDVFQRNSRATWRFRWGLLRHAQPTQAPWAVKTLVEQPMGWFGQMNLWGSAEDIAKAARHVYTKRTGKQRGLDVIEQQIRSTVERRYLKHADNFSKASRSRIEDYVDERMGYVHNAFRALGNPATDRSDERADYIGDFETHSAKSFGRTLGWEFSGREISKEWVAEADACELCLANADDGPIPVEEDFASGDYTVPAHLFCKCTIRYVEDYQ